MSKEDQDLNKIIDELMKKEDRKDAEFRLALLSSEMGDLAKYITHDPKLNPNARPHGTKEGETLAFGEAIVMLRSLAYARGIDYNQAQEQGLKNWQEADWRKREAQALMPGVIEGTVIKEGYAKAKAYVVSREHPIKAVKKEKEKPIVILAHADPDVIIYLDYAAGFVTDHGGKTCHLAVLTLDEIISKHVPPSIIGTGNATQVIKHGELITIDAGFMHGTGYVKREK